MRAIWQEIITTRRKNTSVLIRFDRFPRADQHHHQMFSNSDDNASMSINLLHVELLHVRQVSTGFYDIFFFITIVEFHDMEKPFRARYRLFSSPLFFVFRMKWTRAPGLQMIGFELECVALHFNIITSQWRTHIHSAVTRRVQMFAHRYDQLVRLGDGNLPTTSVDLNLLLCRDKHRLMPR